MSLVTGILTGALTFFQTTGYVASQGWQQAKLLARRVPVERVVRTGSETPERLEKLRLVAPIKAFARDKLNLVPGNSYESYIPLDGTSVTWIVQAAERRSLRFHTWWFPVVGNQPYLGFFRKEDAKEFQEQMKDEGFDTTMGGVQAFSMLGYLADPLYSSMLDGNSIPDFVEVVLHESVHATIYLPNFSSFNENLANFVAMKGTLAFFREHTGIKADVESFRTSYERNLAAQQKFRPFLLKARQELEEFYQSSETDPALRKEAAFLAERSRRFDRLAEEYKTHMAGAEQGTSYAWAFSKGRINNAVILGYSLYEAHYEPFEKAYASAGQDVARLVANLKACLKDKPANESELWKRVETCR